MQAAGYSLVQFTLVDCPGHASLIRTIIGGAQVSSRSGAVLWHARTAACLMAITLRLPFIQLGTLDAWFTPAVCNSVLHAGCTPGC
jgi:hypothetical protein